MPLTESLLFPLALLAALGSALIAGVFYAFSTFVMRALARLPTPTAVSAMQSINIAVINPLFLTPFLGTALLSAATLLLALLHRPHPATPWLLAASLLYLLGTFGVTIALNVPLNNTLAPADPDHPATPALWSRYLSRWTLYNHLRTTAALLAATAYTLALRHG